MEAVTYASLEFGMFVGPSEGFSIYIGGFRVQAFFCRGTAGTRAGGTACEMGIGGCGDGGRAVRWDFWVAVQ